MKSANMQSRTPHHHSLFWMLLEQLFWSKFQSSSTPTPGHTRRPRELFNLQKVFEELSELEAYVKELP